MGSHKTEIKTCPGCGETKELRVDQTYCSRSCSSKASQSKALDPYKSSQSKNKDPFS